MSATTAAAPTANSSPNTKSPLPGKDEKSWKAEIHTAPEYNGSLPVADIVPDPANRKEYDAAELEELKESIKSEGLLQPIVVRPCPKHQNAVVVRHVVEKREVHRVFSDKLEPGTGLSTMLYESADARDAERAAAIYRSGAGWQIIAGERRWRAHMLGKLATIRAFIHRSESDLSAVGKQIDENLKREDLNPMEEARQMKRLSDLGQSQKEIGKRFGGKSQPVVAQTLALLKLPAPVQAMVAKRELSAAHAAELVRFAAWPTACECMARNAAGSNWSAKQIRERSLPFDWELRKAQFAEEIYCGDYSYDARPKYKIPDALKDKPGFFKTGYDTWTYLSPEDGSPNLWEPEKKKQDLAREALAQIEQKKAAAAKKDGKPTKEQKERAAQLAKNKAARAALAEGLAKAEERLNMVKIYDPACIRVMALQALESYQVSKRVEEAAKAVGITLPKGFNSRTIEGLSKLAPVDLMLVVTTAINRMRAHYAHRDAAKDLPETIAHVLPEGGRK